MIFDICDSEFEKIKKLKGVNKKYWENKIRCVMW